MSIRRHTWLSKRLHRWGVARQLNQTIGPDGWQTAYVQTALPIAALARYGCRRWNARIVSRKRTGRFEWRWHLQPRRPRW